MSRDISLAGLVLEGGGLVGALFDLVGFDLGVEDGATTSRWRVCRRCHHWTSVRCCDEGQLW
jgi:hypothetical protein